MLAWSFFVYVTPNGRDAIRDWIKGRPAGTRQRLQAALDALISDLMLINSDHPFDRSQGVGQLRHKCADLFELIMKVDKAQYRAIGFYGPDRGEFTLLSMDTEKGSRLEEDPNCERAHDRRATI